MERPILLVVDDMPENIQVLYHLLKNDYDIFSATTGSKALTLARSLHPDLILLDVMMPEMDGYEVCAALKRDDATREIPVVFITATMEANSETRALSAGGVDFIHKPINAEVVRLRVRLHLELAQHRHHLEELVHVRTRELAEARDAAESASRAKSAFLATMGHELRTPMNHIVGTAYLMAREITDKNGKERLAKIQQAAQSLLGLVSNILDYSRSESDEIRIEAIDFDLAALIGRAVGTIRQAAAAKGIVLVTEIDPDLPPWLKGDSHRLLQVLGSLLGNAVKFSDGGRITVRAHRYESHAGSVTLRFEVEDQGIGVPPELQESIFQLFQQGDSTSTRKYGGAGLGLALSQRLVALMGGEMGVDSSPDRGSTFWFTLRLPAVAAPSVNQLSGPPDRNQAGAVAASLDRLLADDDAEAHLRWEESRHLLEPLLGGRREAFVEAMELFDFETALALLREAVAATPG